MSSATKRGPGRWLGRYRDASGRERTKTLPTKGEALAWAQEQERRIRRGEWADPSKSRVTVREWAKQWEATLVVKPKTRDTYQRIVKNHVLPRWGNVRLDQIALGDVKAWIAGMRGRYDRELSASQKTQAYRVFSMMLDLAVEDGRLSRNPAKPTSGRIKGMLPRATKTHVHTYLTPTQLEALATHCGDYGLFVLTLGYTGLRWGEATALTVADVDILNRRLHVRRSVSNINGQLVFGTPKTHATRAVPITASLAKELDAAIEGRPASAPLFPAPGGGYLHVANFRRRVFDKAVKTARVPKVTPHDLRHTAASIAISSGANVKVVQRMLGHASASMTLDLYAGLFDDDLDVLSERLETTYSEARADYLRIAGQESDLTIVSEDGPKVADQRKRDVPPAGFEPATHGLGNRRSIP